MAKYLLALIIVLLGGNSAIAQGLVCRAELGQKIDSLIQQPEWERSRFGILVEHSNQAETIYELASQQLFIPASNAKLLTTAAAMIALGEDYQIETPLYTIGDKLIWIGQGDPSLDHQRVEFMARRIAKEKPNLKYIEIVDNYFLDSPTDPTWEWSDLAFYYGSPVTSVIYNENTFDLVVNPGEVGEPVEYYASDAIAAQQWHITNEGVTVAEGGYGLGVRANPFNSDLTIDGTLPIRFTDDTWGMSVPNPSVYLGETLKALLHGHGVAIEEINYTDIAPTYLGKPMAFYQPFDILYSPTIAELISDTNLPSNNLYAESLFQQIGATLNQNPSAALEAVLEPLGVNPDSYRLADGSGLSRHNLVSPEAIVDTLQAMGQSSQAELFKQSLPIGGESGTLRRRFKDSDLTGQVFAKTGTLLGNSALSGYVNSPTYGPLTFSIMVNNSDQSTAQQRAAIDQIVTWFYYLDDC